MTGHKIKITFSGDTEKMLDDSIKRVTEKLTTAIMNQVLESWGLNDDNVCSEERRSARAALYASPMARQEVRYIYAEAGPHQWGENRTGLLGPVLEKWGLFDEIDKVNESLHEKGIAHLDVGTKGNLVILSNLIILGKGA